MVLHPGIGSENIAFSKKYNAEINPNHRKESAEECYGSGDRRREPDQAVVHGFDHATDGPRRPSGNAALTIVFDHRLLKSRPSDQTENQPVGLTHLAHTLDDLAVHQQKAARGEL